MVISKFGMSLNAVYLPATLAAFQRTFLQNGQGIALPNVKLHVAHCRLDLRLI